MTNRENLFRPIHKGLRSMIYELGLRLGTTDFTNVSESNAIAELLKQELTQSLPNCLVCLLLTHSVHEEDDIFAPVRPFDPDVVELMLKEHRAIVRQVHEISKICDQLRSLQEPNHRIEAGDQLHQSASDLFAYYLMHMNNEEATLVPVMWDRFSDEQLRALRAQFYNRIPLTQFETSMRWTLPALNPIELQVLLTGMKSDPSPNRFSDAMRVGKEMLGADRWAVVEEQLGQ